MVRPHTLRGYDQTTGQMYEETQVPVTSMVSAWPTKCNGKKQRPRDYRHRGPGCSSLYHMAMRSCAWHINLFVPNDLQCADWHFAQKIYDYLQKNQNLTATAWSLFQQAFPGEKELNHTYPIRIPARHGDAPTELPSIQQWLQHLPFSHLSLLNIQSLSLRLDHLIALTNLPNLGVLLVRHNFEGPKRIDDKAMRDWSRAVQEKDAFSKLRVVGLHHHPASLRATLSGLASFPALRICTVEPHTPVCSEQAAVSQIASPTLPFELLSKTNSSSDNDPEAIWSRESFSGHTKMKMLYDLAGRLQQPPHPKETPDPPVLSVYYGAERTFAYARYPLWFKRLVESDLKQQDDRPLKRTQKSGENKGRAGGGEKKRKIREEKQKDVGALLGGFG